MSIKNHHEASTNGEPNLPIADFPSDMLRPFADTEVIPTVSEPTPNTNWAKGLGGMFCTTVAVELGELRLGREREVAFDNAKRQTHPSEPLPGDIAYGPSVAMSELWIAASLQSLQRFGGAIIRTAIEQKNHEPKQLWTQICLNAADVYRMEWYPHRYNKDSVASKRVKITDFAISTMEGYLEGGDGFVADISGDPEFTGQIARDAMPVWFAVATTEGGLSSPGLSEDDVELSARFRAGIKAVAGNDIPL